MMINQLLDISCVQAIHTQDEIDDMIETAIKYDVACAFTLPGFTEYIVKNLKPKSNVHVGGVVGFPSGGETTEMKVMQAENLRNLGCDELDMVMNLTAFSCGKYDDVQGDIEGVVRAARGIPVKVIIEAPSLAEDQIGKAVGLCIDSGASYIKTSTGWQEKKTQVRHIELISRYTDDKIKIKAAGGIRDLSTIESMYELGCTRFGVNINTAKSLLDPK